MPRLHFAGAGLAASMVAIAGCSVDSGGSGNEEPLGDGGFDVLADDSGGRDSFVPLPDVDIDTNVPDTGGPDTTSTDSGTPDTGTPDPDTGTPDTGVETGADAGAGDADAPATGLLSCSSASGPSGGTVVSLSTEGTLDWAHWGRGGAGNWNHKSGGTILPSRGTVSGTANGYDGYTISFAWTGGAPTATESGKNEGIWFGAGTDGIAFTAGADTVATRTIKVWTAYTGAGNISFTLSDGSAASWSGPISGGGGGNVPMTFTCDYRAKTSGATLTVKVAHASGFATTLFAAAVK